MSRLSRAEVCERIWDIEARYGLFERRIAGLQYWPLFRADLGYLHQVANETSQAGKPSLRMAERLGRLVRSELRAASSPSWTAANSVVVPFHRKAIVSGEVTDRYLGPILAEPKLGPFLALEILLADQRLAPEEGLAVSYLDQGATWVMARGFFEHRALLDEARREHAVLEAAHQQAFGQPYPLTARRMAQRVSHFRLKTAHFKRKLARTGARRVFLPYHDPALIAGAKGAGMTVVEVQHGAITRYSLQHHYPTSPVVDYSADQLWLFGPRWMDSLQLPGNTRPVVAGYGVVDSLRRRSTPRVAKSALINSHLPNDGRLFEQIVATAAAMPDWSFVFRAHPQEDIASYHRKLAQTSLSNLRLSSPREDVYDLLASAETQIGVCSTTLFEGMALGLRTIVMDLPGSQMLDDAVAAGDAVRVAPGTSLSALLGAAPVSQLADGYYASPISGEEMLAQLGA